MGKASRAKREANKRNPDGPSQTGDGAIVRMSSWKWLWRALSDTDTALGWSDRLSRFALAVIIGPGAGGAGSWLLANWLMPENAALFAGATFAIMAVALLYVAAWRRRSVAQAAATLIIFLASLPALGWWLHDALPLPTRGIVEAWRSKPSNVLAFDLNTDPLRRFRHSHQVVVVCRAPDYSVSFDKDPATEMSKPFPISGQRRTIHLNVSAALVRRINAAGGFECRPALVPKEQHAVLDGRLEIKYVGTTVTAGRGALNGL